MQESPELLTTTQVAELLLVTPTTVHNWAKRGRLESIVLPGGHRRFRREDVEALLTPRAGDAA